MKNFLMAFIFFFSFFIISCGSEDSSDPTAEPPEASEASQDAGSDNGDEGPAPDEPSAAEANDLEEPAPRLEPESPPLSADSGSALVRTVACSNGSNQIVFKLYKPFTADNGVRYLCYLIDSRSAVLANAQYQEDYCETDERNGLRAYIARWTSRGYTCS